MKGNKKYKALMLDLDGTTIPNKRHGRPSEKVKKAIAKASKILHVGAVTGRPYHWAKRATNHLSLTAPLIISGGSQIIDSVTGKVLWEKVISAEDTATICNLLKNLEVSILIQDKDSEKDTIHNISHKITDAITMAIKELSQNQADEIIKVLKKIPTIAAHKTPGWKENTVWIQITHVEATKQYGIFEVAKILGIETHEIIGVGEGYNDFPLLMACGLKVAMGNAVPELKEIADYIAPTVEEDGVVDVIEKFVLGNN